METKKLSQKEYLKKYLGGGDKKKKIKKHKIKNPTVQIIDDDINLESIRPMDDAEFDIINATEDAPIIVGVIDERGPVNFDDRKKWKIIADDGDGNVTISANQNYLDTSPPTSSKNHENSSKSPQQVDSDQSPPRAEISREKKNKHHQQSRCDSDLDSSPPRKLKHHSRESKKMRNNLDIDLSPPRKSKHHSRESKRTRHDSDLDLSPPRKSKHHSSESRRARHDSDVDLSPPRKSKHHSRESRQSRHDSHLDLSPPRKSKNHSRESRQNSELDLSPPRRSKHGQKRSVSRWNDNSAKSPTPEVNGRLKKTMDGKTAGLQNAMALREETLAHKQKEKEMFNKMSAEVSGYGQAAVVRDRRTGKRRDFAAEELERQEKEKRQKEIDDKYSKWGRGLKQVDDRAEKLKQDMYEMSKPLARYADDADLDAKLRAVQHEFEDPIRLFSKDQQSKPSYRNSSMPNRFGIKPGHRWDGVDRSNGYEKKWFEAKNARAAVQEEAYKWSTSDM